MKSAEWTKNTGTMPVSPDTIVVMRGVDGTTHKGRAGDFWWHQPEDQENWFFLVVEWKHVED